jgi:hypothetical protein
MVSDGLDRGPQDEDEGQEDTASPGQEIGGEPDAGDDAPASPRAPAGVETRGQRREDEEREQALRHVVVRVADERPLQELAGQESHDRRREDARRSAKEPPPEREDGQGDERAQDRRRPGEDAVHERGRGRAPAQRPGRGGESEREERRLVRLSSRVEAQPVEWLRPGEIPEDLVHLPPVDPRVVREEDDTAVAEHDRVWRLDPYPEGAGEHGREGEGQDPAGKGAHATARYHAARGEPP